MAIETTNDFAVGLAGGDVVIMAWGKRMTRDRALRLAAWLVAMGDGSDDQGVFQEQLNAVLNS